MASLSQEKLLSSIKAGKFAPIYLLYGDEEFLVDEATNAVIAHSVDQDTREFNFDLFHGPDAVPEIVAARANSYPLMAEKRVVVVREFDKMLATKYTSDGMASFVRYLLSPSETTVLVLSMAASETSSRGKTAAKGPLATVMERAQCVQFKKVYDRDIPAWISSRITQLGKSIANDALELFINYSGNSLRMISNEIEKLFTFVQDRKRIVVDDIQSVVGASKAYNVFELQRAIGARNLESSMYIADRMLNAGDSVQMIISMLFRYFTVLWRLDEARKKTRDTSEMARLVGMSPYFITEYVSALSRYSRKEIGRAFEQLANTDLILKSTRTPDDTALQMLLVAVVGSGVPVIVTA